MANEVKKNSLVSFVDILRVSIASLIFIGAIIFMLWIVSVQVMPNPDLDMDKFIAEFIKRSIVTIVLVTSGVDAAYSLGHLIMISFGSSAYNKNSPARSVAQRYIETKNDIRYATDIINKYGMNIEFEEVIDYVNYEYRTNVFEKMIKKAERSKIKQIHKKKNRIDLNKSAELRQELHDIKSHNVLISKQKYAITRFDRAEYLEYDNHLVKVYGEPIYNIVYSSQIFENKDEKSNSILSKIFGKMYIVFRERIKPVINPLLFVGLTTYYIIAFGSDPNNKALLIAVGITTTFSVLGAFIIELTRRFKRENLDPLEDAHYIMRKFISKNKKKIDVLEKGEKTIEEFLIEEQYHLEKMKKDLALKNEIELKEKFQKEAVETVKVQLKDMMKEVEKEGDPDLFTLKP